MHCRDKHHQPIYRDQAEDLGVHYPVKPRTKVGATVVAFLAVLTLGQPHSAAQTLYWDTKNGNGAGDPATGTWDTTTANWNASSSGPGSRIVWANGNTAVFSTGTDATSAFAVTVSSNFSVAGITSEEGLPTLTGGTLTLTGNTVNVLTGSTLTINSTIAGSVGLTKTGTGTLALGGTNTYTGTTTISAGTLQTNTGINFSGGLELGPGATLALNGQSVTASTLNVTGNSFIDFSSGSSTLNLNSLTVAANVTLTINGWVDMVDFFLLNNSPTLGTGASIIFTNYSGSATWNSSNKQFTPVPESTSYGALFIGFSTAGFLLRRSPRRSTV